MLYHTDESSVNVTDVNESFVSRLADLSLAPASALSATQPSALSGPASVDPSYLAAALRAEQAAAVSRGFSAVRVAGPPAGVAFGAAPATVATIRGAHQFMAPGAGPHLYAPFQ